MSSLRACVAAVAIAWLPATARADASPLHSSAWDGDSALVEVLSEAVGQTSLDTSGRVDYSALTPKDALLVIRPEVELDVESIAAFMREGGRVVMLDETERGDVLLDRFAIRRAPPPREPAQALRHNPALALAIAASDPPHPSADGVGRLVTNHPTTLVHPDLTPVLSIPTLGGEAPLLAVAGAVGQGRLLVVGDGSILQNAMLRYPGNRAFARGLARYALDDDAWGTRHGTLFVVAGRFEQRGTYGAAKDDTGPKALWRAAKARAAALAREGLSPDAALGLAALIATCVLLWVLTRTGRLHRPTVPGYARGVPVLAQGGVAGHAALISAPGTSRVLALLELKSALEEELSLMCGFDRSAGSDALLRAVEERALLSPPTRLELRALLARLAHAETTLIARRSSRLPRTSDAEVLGVARVMQRVLSEARARAASRPA